MNSVLCTTHLVSLLAYFGQPRSVLALMAFKNEDKFKTADKKCVTSCGGWG